jgi:molecular chaperone DnaK (HSP70)
VFVAGSWVQVAVVGFVKGKLTVKATSADQSLGGRDFDDLLYEHFRKEFMDKNKVDLNTKPRSKIRLLTECEKLKKLMSANTASLPINVECLTDEHDFHSRMGR